MPTKLDEAIDSGNVELWKQLARPEIEQVKANWPIGTKVRFGSSAAIYTASVAKEGDIGEIISIEDVSGCISISIQGKDKKAIVSSVTDGISDSIMANIMQKI